MEDLAMAVKLAAEIRENSWNDDAHTYDLTIQEAADKAAEQVGFDTRGTRPVFLLLFCCWNEALDWAEEVLK